jgi:hypothetical protein
VTLPVAIASATAHSEVSVQSVMQIRLSDHVQRRAKVRGFCVEIQPRAKTLDDCRKLLNLDPHRLDAILRERDAGAVTVECCERIPSERHGATDIVSERGEAGVARIKELTKGVGADSVLECVGTKNP